MENVKITETVLKNAYQNIQMALVSLDDVIKIAQGALKEELLNQHEGYEKIITDISVIAHGKNITLPDVGAMKKTMVAASISMKTMMDDSDSHIAEMTLKGTVTGVTELIKDISEYGHLLDKEVYDQLEILKQFEEQCEENLKKYL
ncbi:MAG: hypothetical protein SO373_07410 [Candidatus Borkfalkiaceae bacterium]|nr:hypothetical protein [Christensenellaceae bacterium]